MPSLLTSRAALHRLAAARAWLTAGGAPAVVLAASRRAGQQLVRDAAAEGKAPFGVFVLTVGQLAAELVRGAADEPTPLTPLGAETLAARALARCRAAGTFTFLEEVASAPGLPRALVRTLTELRHHGVGAGELAARPSPAGLGARGNDLARLLAAYEEELAQARLADLPALLARAVFRVAVEPAGRHAGRRLLLLDLALRSPLEVELVATLAAAAPQVMAVAPAADGRALAALESALGTAARALDEPSPGASGVARARFYVFGAEAPMPQTALDDGFLLVSAPGEGAEGVEIARRLLALARQGIAFDRCAVLLRDPARYQPLLEEALDRAGIPALFTRGVVRPHPAGRALLALLDCALEGLSAIRFAEYLSLGQVPPVDEEGAPPPRPVPWLLPDEEERLAGAVPGELLGPTASAGPGPAVAGEDDASPVVAGSLRTPLNWERLLVEASVIGGLDRWRRRLAGLAGELAVHRAACADDEPARAEHLGRQLARLATLERFALPLVETLAELPATSDWAGWLEHLERLASRALRQPQRVLETLAELRPMGEVGPVTLAEVRLALADRLTNLRASPEGTPYGRVFVAGIDEARGRSFDTVFLPGLVEGVFPRKAFEDPLLLDGDRERLATAGVGRPLARQDQRVAEERLLLALALGAAETRLVASFPTLDGREGRARVASFYALDLVRAVEGSLPRLAGLMRRAAAGSALRLGWPAPRDPDVAIDSAEYDLAVLAPLLAAPEEEGRGRARFLLQLEPTLARSLRARWQRWSRRFTPADGLVDPDSAAREALAADALGGKVLSATALQQLAACPYRFLLHALHGLRPREEAIPLEELDPLTRGEIFHAVQAAALGELARRQRLPLAEADAREALDLLDATLDRLAEDYRERLAPALPRVWESEIEEMRVDLRGWLREQLDAAGTAPGWIPAHFELGFGLPRDERRDPASRAAAVDILGKLRLRGAIDLVETSADGATLRATDHKTGRPPDTQLITIGGGEILQPLLYALAAAAVLGKPAHSGRLYFCTRRGGYRSFEVPLHELSLLALRQVLDLLAHSLHQGFLPAAPRQGACARCDYRPVCGPWEERRIARKPPADLARLKDVRSYE